MCLRGHYLIRGYFYYSHLNQNCQTENSCKIFFPMQGLRACPNKNLRFLANCLCCNKDVACHRTLPGYRSMNGCYIAEKFHFLHCFYDLEIVDTVSTIFFEPICFLNSRLPCVLCCFIISAFYENLYGYAYFLRLSRFKNKKYALFPKKLCQNSLFA